MHMRSWRKLLLERSNKLPDWRSHQMMMQKLLLIVVTDKFNFENIKFLNGLICLDEQFVIDAMTIWSPKTSKCVKKKNCWTESCFLTITHLGSVSISLKDQSIENKFVFKQFDSQLTRNFHSTLFIIKDFILWRNSEENFSSWHAKLCLFLWEAKPYGLSLGLCQYSCYILRMSDKMHPVCQIMAQFLMKC